MRDLLLTQLAGASLGSFSLSQELPYDSSGVPLYLKNSKRIYVDSEQITTTPVVDTLDELTILQEETTVAVYMTCDAKQRPADYGDVCLNIRALRRTVATPGATTTVGIQAEYEADILVTRFEFVNTRLLPPTL